MPGLPRTKKRNWPTGRLTAPKQVLNHPANWSFNGEKINGVTTSTHGGLKMGTALEAKELNDWMKKQVKENKKSYGLGLFIDLIKTAQNANRTFIKNGSLNRCQIKIYTTFVTDNRLSAHIIVQADKDSRYQSADLVTLRIPEAGFRSYAGNNDGYQMNGGNYNKPDKVLEAMVYAASKHMDPYAHETAFSATFLS